MRRTNIRLAVLCFGSAFAVAMVGVGCGGGGGKTGEGDDESPEASVDGSPKIESGAGDTSISNDAMGSMDTSVFEASAPFDAASPDATESDAASPDAASPDATESDAMIAALDGSPSDASDEGATVGSTGDGGDGGSAEAGPGGGGDSGSVEAGSGEDSGGADAGPGGSGGDGGDGGVAPTVVTNIVVDQFGYRTGDPKVAIVRSPITGFDSSPFVPGPTYALVEAATGAVALRGAPVTWNGGATDPSSGDAAWSFDFSSVTAPGSYYVLDELHEFRSATFAIADTVYADALVQAVRSFYYQRDGIAKPVQYAGPLWTDNEAHPQDGQCTAFAALDGGVVPDAGSTLDLHGGWFDAADQNKYTIWAASNVIELLRAYEESPATFSGTAGDTYDIPESLNSIPDILDEATWGLEWLGRMQQANGSVLTIVGNWNGTGTTNGGDPPSSDTAPCVYGGVSTSATWSAAAAFAYGALVLQPWKPTLASALETQAIDAWGWATQNPSVTYDNPPGFGTYDQELDTTGRMEKQVQAAVFLFELGAAGSSAYQAVVDANYAELESSFAPSRIEQLDTVLEYAKLPGATSSVATAIWSTFESSVDGASVAGMVPTDPYRGYVATYDFTGYLGSNQAKAGQGNMFYDLIAFSSAGVDAGSGGTPEAGAGDATVADATTNDDGDAGSSTAEAGVASAGDAGPPEGPAAYALGYLHYFHGVNPLALVYLTNMNGDYLTNPSAPAVAHSLTATYSAWFTGTPPPGYVVAGPNPQYDWESCCGYDAGSPNACGDGYLLNLCEGTSPPSPPYGQPPQKSYKDFNNGWPLDSWLVSEANDAYMAQYIRLVSKFVP
jgi:hypothetical protein